MLSNEGYDGASDTYSVARWSQLFGKETFTLKITEDIGAINELGEFAALIDTGPLSRGTPCRVGNQIDWIASTSNAYSASSINDSGDVGYLETVTTGKGKRRVSLEKAFFYHESQDQEYSIDGLVADSFLSSSRQLAVFVISRDNSLTIPTPTIVGSVNNDGQVDYRIYFLIPGP